MLQGGFSIEVVGYGSACWLVLTASLSLLAGLRVQTERSLLSPSSFASIPPVPFISLPPSFRIDMTRQDDSQGVGCFANGPLPVQTAGGTGIMWKLTEAQRMRKCLSQLDPPRSLYVHCVNFKLLSVRLCLQLLSSK